MGREILDLAPPPPAHVLRYSAGEDPNHFGHLRLPPGPPSGPWPVAVLLHGGFWRAARDLQHMGHMGAALAAHGIASWTPEYRRIGQPGGGWPGTGDDVRRALAHLAEIATTHLLDANRVLVAGFSAGGHLALWAAAERILPLRGALSLAGVADLRRAWELRLGDTVAAEFLGGSPQEVPDRYRAASPIERLPIAGPLRLFHGEKDDVVPVAVAHGFTDAARRAGCDVALTAFPGAGHFELIDPRTEEYARVHREVARLLLAE